MEKVVNISIIKGITLAYILNNLKTELQRQSENRKLKTEN